MNNKKIYIIADAHLGAKPQALSDLVTWVKGLDAANTQLIFLGDLFHIWAAPKKYHSEDVTLLMCALEEFKQASGKSSLVVGNRDVFFKTGDQNPMKHLPFDEIALDFLQVKVGEKTLLCTHGDLVNSKDKQYLRWRRLLRSKLLRIGFAFVPAAKVKAIMMDLENKLKGTNQAFRIAFPVAEWENFLLKVTEKYPFDLLVVGHFHPAEPVVSEIASATAFDTATAIVIPDWFAEKKALAVNNDLEYEIITTP
ncbi:MAG: hypothetical protein QNL04_13245 [SAR324 cluster bacterium]|nr:hypothetical protein [SAR324 cluster bacterium]